MSEWVKKKKPSKKPELKLSTSDAGFDYTISSLTSRKINILIFSHA